MFIYNCSYTCLFHFPFSWASKYKILNILNLTGLPSRTGRCRSNGSALYKLKPKGQHRSSQVKGQKEGYGHRMNSLSFVSFL